MYGNMLTFIFFLHTIDRVSSSKTKELALKLFFDRYPNPTSCIDANPSEMHECIAPLGLFETRFRSIVEISRAFLSRNVVFNVGLTKEFKIYGIGEFGVDSYNIFAETFVGEKMERITFLATKTYRLIVDGGRVCVIRKKKMR